MKPTATTMLLMILLSCTEAILAGSHAEKSPLPLFGFYSEEKQDIDEVLFFYENIAAVRRAAEVHLSEQFKTAGNLSKGDVFVIDLFGEDSHIAKVQRTGTNLNGSVSVTAGIIGMEGYLVLATTGNRSLGSILLPQSGLFYEIISDPLTHSHYLLELDARDRDIIDHCTPLYSPKINKKKQSIPLHSYNVPHQQPTHTDADYVDIELLVIYTPAAKAWGDFHGGGMYNIIAVSLANAQMVHDNSQTMVKLPVVHTALVDYEETGNSQIDLWRLIASPAYNPFGSSVWGGYGIPGFMDEVHDLRNKYSADLCVLFSYTHDTGGLAHQLVSRHGQPKHGFSLVRVQQAAHSHTLAHELGHNMGGHHHKEQTLKWGPTNWTNWPENQWSAGWRWRGNDGSYYCSVMSYQSGHFYEDGINHLRLPMFSNPGISCAGIQAGHPEDGDNARTILETRNAIANYRVPGMALVSTYHVSDIALFSAVSGGIVTDFDGHPVTQRGLVWDTTPYPRLEKHAGFTVEGNGSGSFYSQINDLEHSTEYYVAAYAKNDVGVAYGAQRFFTTPQPLFTQVSTTKAKVSGHNAATAGGHVSNGGNSEVYQRGVVWSTALNPTVTEHDGMTLDGSGTGVFESHMRDLKPETRYFYRAYASNQAGTTYGVMHTITTPIASIFPNPFVDKLEVAFYNNSHHDVTIVLKNALGQKVKQKQVTQYGDVHKSFNLHHLESGFYMLSIESEQVFPVWRLVKTDQ